MSRIKSIIEKSKLFSEDDINFMKLAQHQAELAFEQNEVPVGAVIVVNRQVISVAHNLCNQTNNPCDHAELLSIKQACLKLQSSNLINATLYVTLEPCPMCSGAILNSKIGTVIYGASEPKLGSLGSKFHLFADHPMNHFPSVKSGLLAEYSQELLIKFFAKLRQ